jgi:hypothetical protein
MGVKHFPFKIESIKPAYPGDGVVVVISGDWKRPDVAAWKAYESVDRLEKQIAESVLAHPTLRVALRHLGLQRPSVNNVDVYDGGATVILEG